MIKGLLKRLRGAVTALRNPPQRPRGVATSAEVVAEMGMAKLLALLPSLNFFTGDVPMRVHGAWPCRSIYLRLPQGRKAVLDLERVELFRSDGKRIGLERAERVAASSSARGNKPRGLVKGDGFRSRNEVGPWWRIDFKDVEDVGEIRVFNRGGPKAHMNRFLRISRVTPEGRERLIEAPVERAQRLLLEDPVLSGSAELAETMSVEQLREHRRRVLLPNICRSLHESLPGKETMQALLFATDVWPPNQGERMSPMQLTVLANFLARSHIDRRKVKLKDYRSLLPTKASVLKLEAIMNDVLERDGKSPVILTNHGISPAGKLTGRVPETLVALGDAMEELEGLQREPVLAYGSLLGARRNGKFIPHDDDVDILYRVNARDREAAENEVASVRKHFEEKGWKVGSPAGFMNIHLYHPEKPVVIDAFPAWLVDGEWQLHMESMRIRGIPGRILAGRSRVTLYDKEFPAPADIDAFLEERYGESWKTPDRFFGWSWKFRD